MRIPVLSCALLVFSGLMAAQQPVPMGKINDAPRSRAEDGSLLTKHSTDDQVASAVRASFDRDPELRDIQVLVNKHKVTLNGFVNTKDAKMRAESLAERTSSVRSVRDHVKVGGPAAPAADDSSAVSASAH